MKHQGDFARTGLARTFYPITSPHGAVLEETLDNKYYERE